MSKGRKRWTEHAGPAVTAEALRMLRCGEAPLRVYQALKLARFVSREVFTRWARSEANTGGTPVPQGDTGGTPVPQGQEPSTGGTPVPQGPGPHDSTGGTPVPHGLTLPPPEPLRMSDSGSPGSGASPSELLAACLRSLQVSIAANTLPEYRLADVIRALAKLSEIDIKERAEQRALELHETKMAEFRKLQETALETASEAARLTPEQVAEIRAKVLGLA